MERCAQLQKLFSQEDSSLFETWLRDQKQQSKESCKRLILAPRFTSNFYKAVEPKNDFNVSRVLKDHLQLCIIVLLQCIKKYTFTVQQVLEKATLLIWIFSKLQVFDSKVFTSWEDQAK